MKLVSVQEMKAIETAANERGLSYLQMMQNAGNGLAAYTDSMNLDGIQQKVLGLVGPGNNGGDTIIALTELMKRGWESSAYLIKSRTEKEDPLNDFLAAGGKAYLAEEDPQQKTLRGLIHATGFVLDGLLGTGTKLPLKPEAGRLLGTAQKEIGSLADPPVVIAVDCPSGVDCDTGLAAPETIPADITICMAAVKIGLLSFPALGLVGELKVVDIGLPKDLPEWKSIQRGVVDRDLVASSIPIRKFDSHKGTYGTALIVVGSVNFTGAAYLSAQAAYQVGTGLVTLAVPSPLHQVLAGSIPEATWLLLPNELGVISETAVDIVQNQVDKADALLLGPGWGMEETTQKFLERFLQADKAPAPHSMGFVQSKSAMKSTIKTKLPPRVIDADGLKLLSKINGWPNLLDEKTVLTPHPGEMAILTGLQIHDIQTDRIHQAEKFAQEWGKTVVLKGAATVVASPDGHSAVVPIASSALAKAGTGDVLAGVITGLLAQGVDTFTAACCGAWLHAQAGLTAMAEIGNPASVLAGDVAMAIAEVYNELGVADSL